MKRKMRQLAAALTACSMLLGMGTLTAGAESDPNVCTVIGTNEDSVYLSNGCALSQGEFQRYTNASFDLQCGDVVHVKNSTMDPSMPGRYNLNDDSAIEYLGTVNDCYGDLRRELTIVDQDGAKITLADADGTVYTWRTVAYKIMKWFDYKADIDPDSLVPGDVLLCTVEEDSVTYPVQVNALTKADLLGDVTGDGELGLTDIIALNQSILHIKPLADTKAFLAADMNLDRTIDIFDLALLKKEILTK